MSKKAELGDEAVPKAKPKARAKSAVESPKPVAVKVKAKPAKPAAKPPAPEAAPAEDETLSPEDAKIREYFKNPNVTFTGVYRAKILEWIVLYENIGHTNEIWREPAKVWDNERHVAYESWSRFIEGLNTYDVQQLMRAALESQQYAMVEMLACWFAKKIRGMSPDAMIREMQQS